MLSHHTKELWSPRQSQRQLSRTSEDDARTLIILIFGAIIGQVEPLASPRRKRGVHTLNNSPVHFDPARIRGYQFDSNNRTSVVCPVRGRPVYEVAHGQGLIRIIDGNGGLKFRVWAGGLS